MKIKEEIFKNVALFAFIAFCLWFFVKLHG